MLVALAVLCVVGVLVPPLGSAVSRYGWAESVQFIVLAAVAPALLVVGAPWRLRARPPGTGLPDRVARSRSRRSRPLASWGFLIAFLLAVIVWRLPPVVDALARHPLLALLELATLFPAGCALYLELVASPPLVPRIVKPLRALFAALSMWAIWVLAYIMGFSSAGWFSVYAHHGGPALSPAADQQVATGILWAVPAFCFMPVIFFSMISWLNDSSDPDDELRALSRPGRSGKRLGPQPPRGWRSPRAG